MLSDNPRSMLRSYVFWKKQYDHRPEKNIFGGFVFPTDPYDKWQEVMESKGVCPICGGGKTFDNPERVYCMCFMVQWLHEKRARTNGLEARIMPARLADLKSLPKPVNGESGSEELKYLKKELSAWIVDPKSWFLISGGTGSGKTHVLRAIKTYFQTMAFYISAESFQGNLFQALNGSLYGMNVQDLLNELVGAPILLFDDLGIEHSNAFFTDSLAAVINRRYNAGPENFPVVMTTNLAVSKLVTSTDLALQRIGSRMADEQFSIIAKLKQPDYRLSTTKKG